MSGIVDNEYVSISIPRRLLERINKHRKQHTYNKEPQNQTLERMVKFYEENYREPK